MSIPLDSTTPVSLKKTYEITHVYRYPFNWVVGSMWKRVHSDSTCNLKNTTIVKDSSNNNILDITREIDVNIELPYYLQFFFPAIVTAKVQEKSNLDINAMRMVSTTKVLNCNVDYKKYIDFETETVIQFIPKTGSLEVNKDIEHSTDGLANLLAKLQQQKKEVGLPVLNRRSTFSTLNVNQTYLPQNGKTLYNQKLHIVNYSLPTPLVDFAISMWKKRFTPIVVKENPVVPI
jgi:hypothetical protein